MGRMYP